VSEKVKRIRFMFDVDAWLSSTAIAAMSAEQERAYLRLLLHMWKQDDCGLPDDQELLAGLSTLGERWATVGARVRAQFFEKDGRLYNARLLEEWGYQQEFHAKSKGKASTAAKTRWGRREQFDNASRNASSNAPSITQAMPEQCLGDAIANSEKRIAAKAAASPRAREAAPPPPPDDHAAGDFAQLAEAMHAAMPRGSLPPDAGIVAAVLGKAGSLEAALMVCAQLGARRDRPRSYALFATVAAAPPVPRRTPGVLEMPQWSECAECGGLGFTAPDAPPGLSPSDRCDWMLERRQPCACQARKAAAA
jgi:uncharacterized protein YdaU (DUF1376 family)